MAKYIVFALMIIALTLNYSVAAVARVLLKKELTEKQIITVKSILYVFMLLGVIYIMFISK